MICYADKTWCRDHERCKNGSTCGRALTNDVVEKAKKWWGSDDFPISVYIDAPDCFEKKIEFRPLTEEEKN